MSYIENNLLNGEKIIRKAKIHWFIFVPGATILVLSIMFMSHAPHDAVGIGFIPLIISLFMLLKAFIDKISIELAVTDKRVIAKWGLVARRTIELYFSKIESLNVDQGVWGRIFNFGKVSVNGTGGIHTPFPFIEQPLAFRRTVNEQFEATSHQGSSQD